jgi:hypothetical protein
MKGFFVVVLFAFLSSCNPATDLTSGELYCDALLNCSDSNVSGEIGFERCVAEYDSNPCSGSSTKSCFRVFTFKEKECLTQGDSCDFWKVYPDCLN